MNLRHIDPRSTDWMDAMLEGEWEGSKQKGMRRQSDQPTDAHANAVGILAAGVQSGAEAQGPPQAPAR